mgnify:CR=1 FL=1
MMKEEYDQLHFIWMDIHYGDKQEIRYLMIHLDKSDILLDHNQFLTLNILAIPYMVPSHVKRTAYVNYF